MFNESLKKTFMYKIIMNAMWACLVCKWSFANALYATAMAFSIFANYVLFFSYWPVYFSSNSLFEEDLVRQLKLLLG